MKFIELKGSFFLCVINYGMYWYELKNSVVYCNLILLGKLNEKINCLSNISLKNITEFNISLNVIIVII